MKQSIFSIGLNAYLDNAQNLKVQLSIYNLNNMTYSIRKSAIFYEGYGSAHNFNIMSSTQEVVCNFPHIYTTKAYITIDSYSILQYDVNLSTYCDVDTHKTALLNIEFDATINACNQDITECFGAIKYSANTYLEL